MSVEPPTSGKAAPPPLFARAPRPPVVRIRRAAVLAGAGVAALVAGSALTWVFVVEPRVRAAADRPPTAAQPPAADGEVKPSPMVTEQPASYDRLPPPRGSEAPPMEAAAAPAPPTSRPPPKQPSPAQQRLEAARASGLLFADLSSPKPAPVAAAEVRGGPGASEGDLSAPPPPFSLLAGSVIPAALLNAVDTRRPGPVSAMVSAGVYDSVSGRTLLVPQGARLIGRQASGSRQGDKRAYIEWTRLILPDGSSVTLDAAPAVDAQGAVGAPGRVDRRLGPLALAALAAGALTTLGQAARDDDAGGGWLGDAGDAAAIEAARTGGRLVDRELSIAPSIRLEAGTAVSVLLTRDLRLRPYAP